MALTRQDLQVIASLVSAMINERPAPVAIAGHVVPGSYHPLDGTIEVLIDDTDAAYVLAQALGDADSTQPLPHTRVPIVGIDPSDHYGPRGGEPVGLFHGQYGYYAKLHGDAQTEEAPGAGPFFSVHAPSGERWIMHRNASGQLDSGTQLTNDGPTPGDGLGGTLLGNNGALTEAITKSGHFVSLNDTSKQIRIETAGVGNPSPMTSTYSDVTQSIEHAAGTLVSTTLTQTATVQEIIHEAAANVQTIIDGVAQKIVHQSSPAVKTIVDAAGNAISHVISSGGKVYLGTGPGQGNFGSLVPGITKTDMTSLISDASVGINIQRWVDLVYTMKALLLAMGASGVPSLPGLATVVSQMSSVFGTTVPGFSSLPSWSSILVPGGSATVSMLP